MFFPSLISQVHLSFRRLAACLACAGLGCGEPVEPVGPGQLELAWQILPRGCQVAGVTQVRAALEGGAGVEPLERVFACEDGAGLLEQLEPARYQVTLEGLDAGGAATFEAPSREVTVRGEQRNAPTEPFRLSARPAAVVVGWRFDDGRVCGAHGVGRVRVTLFDEGDFEVAREGFACDEGAGLLEDVPAGTYQVLAEAASGASDFWGPGRGHLKRGGRGSAEVILSPMQAR